MADSLDKKYSQKSIDALTKLLDDNLMCIAKLNDKITALEEHIKVLELALEGRES